MALLEIKKSLNKQNTDVLKSKMQLLILISERKKVDTLVGNKINSREQKLKYWLVDNGMA